MGLEEKILAGARKNIKGAKCEDRKKKVINTKAIEFTSDYVLKDINY